MAAGYGRIRRESLERLLEHINLSDFLGSYIDVKRSGPNHVARCPFHNEKSASFYIYDDHYHCFGCKAHGNAIDFEMHRTGASFPEAAMSVAERSRFALEFETTPNDGHQKEAQESARLVHIMNEIAKRYVQYLKSNATEAVEARAYLTNRGFTDAHIDTWQLGLAPANNRLAELAASRGWDVDDLKALGLLRTTSDGAYTYDFFRNRIMFPIHNDRGQVIAFGGRVFLENMKETGPKYVNSPESKLFSKSFTLFNFHRARAHLVRQKNAVVVEGYIDAIALVNAGIENVVAVLGTALTGEHVKKLGRLCETVTLCFDSDAAGQNALVRSFETAYPLNLVNLQCLAVPSGKDPDEFIKANGVGAFEKLLHAPQSLLYRAASILTQQVPNREARLRTIKEKLVPTVLANPDVAQREIAFDSLREFLGLSSAKGLAQNVAQKKMATPVRVGALASRDSSAANVEPTVDWQPESLEILKLTLALCASTADDVPTRLKNTFDDVTSADPMDEIICGKALFGSHLSQTTQSLFALFNALWNIDPNLKPAQWSKEALENRVVTEIPSEFYILKALCGPRVVEDLFENGFETWAKSWDAAPPLRSLGVARQATNLFSLQNLSLLRFLCREIGMSAQSKALRSAISELLLKLEFGYLDKEMSEEPADSAQPGMQSVAPLTQPFERSRRILQERLRRQAKFQG